MTTARPKGFTLIELLIVIGVLGVLAAGLLAAVDPFEQLKKGRDTNLRNVVVELHNSFTRYYATHGELPWCAGVVGVCALNSGTPIQVSNATFEPYLDLVILDGELKGADGADFVSNLGEGNADRVYVNSDTGVSVSVCFAPESKSLFQDRATKFAQDGTADAITCPETGKDLANILSCYWCAK